MTAAETKFRADQNNAAKERLHADMAALAAGDAPAVSQPIADPSRFSEASFARREWLYTMRPGETIDTVKSSGFFKRISSKFGLGDEVIVRSASLEFYSRLLVVASDHIAAHVELRTLQEVKLAPAVRKDHEANGYRVEDTADVLRRLAVIRTVDGKLMKDGFKTRQDAQHYISTELVARAAWCCSFAMIKCSLSAQLPADLCASRTMCGLMRSGTTAAQRRACRER